MNWETSPSTWRWETWDQLAAKSVKSPSRPRIHSRNCSTSSRVLITRMKSALGYFSPSWHKAFQVGLLPIYVSIIICSRNKYVWLFFYHSIAVHSGWRLSNDNVGIGQAPQLPQRVRQVSARTQINNSIYYLKNVLCDLKRSIT